MSVSLQTCVYNSMYGSIMYVVFLHTIPALAGTGLGDTGMGTAQVQKNLSVPVPMVPISMYPCQSLSVLGNTLSL